MGPVTTMTPTSGRQHVALGWVRHDEALTKMAAACWARDRFTDVTIFCEDRVLHAHRLVLASMSPLLANLLAEAEGTETSLMLPEVKAEDMRLLLQFIYQGEVVLPPRRTAALLDLAAQLCVAGVRGGGQTTPPSPPRSDSPEMDSSDRTHDESEDNQVSEDEQHPSEMTPTSDTACGSSSTLSATHSFQLDSKEPPEAEKCIVVDEDEPDANETSSNVGDESNDGPMNLAAKPEIKVNGITNCPRPKPCNSSPPDFNVFQASATASSNTGRNSTNSRNPTLSYYQHPALRGCHPFSLELAVNHHRQLRVPFEHHRSKRQLSSSSSSKTAADSSGAESDVEVTMDVAGGDDHDREIDLSLSNKTSSGNRSSSEEKMTPSPDQDNSLGSNESIEQLKGRGLYIHPSSGSGTLTSTLTDKMFLMPPSGVSGGGSDPRRTYLETVLQESLVQQSYTIVLPSHLSGNTMPMNPDHHHHHQLTPTPLHGQTLDSSKTWNLSGKNSAAAAVAELQCLQGLFASRESNYGRGGLVGTCDEDDGDEEDAELPTNLSTSKNGNCGSSNSLNSKRNGKEGYSCQVCRKMFTSSSNLAVHSMIHSGTKPFKCDLCSWSFRQKAHLQKHMRHIHKIIVAK